jgi:hypothetical protein
MRRLALATCALTLIACSRSEQTPAADSPAAAVAPAALTMADLAGKWTQTVTAENSDSVLVTSEINAGADGVWTITLPGRPPMPVTVMIDGDSITTKTGPYESVLRAGVQVTTEGVSRLVDGKMVGYTIARYSAGPDSVLRLRTTATRAP